MSARRTTHNINTAAIIQYHLGDPPLCGSKTNPIPSSLDSINCQKCLRLYDDGVVQPVQDARNRRFREGAE